MKTIDCCHKMMYGREEGQELNFNWDIMSISYNINHYYSVLSLSTPMSASGTSLPACVEWRTARRERAAWWRWAVKPLQADSAHSHLQGTGQGRCWQMTALWSFYCRPVWHHLLWSPGLVFPGFAPCAEPVFAPCLCSGGTGNCSH